MYGFFFNIGCRKETSQMKYTQDTIRSSAVLHVFSLKKASEKNTHNKKKHRKKCINKNKQKTKEQTQKTRIVAFFFFICLFFWLFLQWIIFFIIVFILIKKNCFILFFFVPFIHMFVFFLSLSFCRTSELWFFLWSQFRYDCFKHFFSKKNEPSRERTYLRPRFLLFPPFFFLLFVFFPFFLLLVSSFFFFLCVCVFL